MNPTQRTYGLCGNLLLLCINLVTMRVVFTVQAPGSLLSYYQQVGRAGRAVDKAYGVLLHGDEDADTHQHFADTAFPNQDDVDGILSALRQCSLGLTEEDLEERRNIRPRHIVQVRIHSC